MKKLLKWALIVVPLLIIIAIVVVLLMLDGIAKRAIETQGTASTKLVTTLDSANISIFGGTVKLNDLKLGSPKGFDAPSMFEMKGLEVKASLGELRQNPIRISEITVDGPKLVVEQKGGALNVNVAMSEMPKSESSTMTMIIGKLVVSNTQVVVRPGLPFLKPEYAVIIPTVTLQNIGSGEGNQNGAAIKDVLKQLLPAMLAKLKDAEGIPPELKALLGGGDIAALAKDQLQKQGQQALDQAKTQGEAQVQQGLQNLLGGATKKGK